MIANAPESAILTKLSALIDSARKFTLEYESALQSFRRRNAIGRLVADKALDYLEEEFNLNRKTLDQAAQTFFVDWGLSPEHQQLKEKLLHLVLESQLILREAYRRPPKLTAVRRASRLPTKASRLADYLEKFRVEIHEWESTGKQLPIRQVRAPPTSRSKSRAKLQEAGEASWRVYFPKTWWEWLGIIAAYVALVYYLPALTGMSRLEAILLGLLIVWLLVGVDMAGRRSFRVPRS